MTLDVFREEKKYEMSIMNLEYVKSQLESCLHGDPINGMKPYLVRSLYFDSYNNIDYWDKELGANSRKKIRLRVYSPDSATAKLELKEKNGSMQRKQSLSVPKEEALELIAGNYEVLLKHDEELASYLYGKMISEMYTPRTIVEYDRIAFGTNENNIRLTIDTGIRANEGYYNIFDENLQLYPVMRSNRGVLEVKYNNFLLSYIKDVIQCVDSIETSVSKYMLARAIGMGGE